MSNNDNHFSPPETVNGEIVPSPEELQTKELQSNDGKKCLRVEQLRLSVPPPNVMKAYEELYPGATKTFFDWSSEESKHRREMDSSLLKSHVKDSRLGLCLGFIVAMTGLGVAAYAVHHHEGWVAAVLGGGTIVSLATAFIRGSQAHGIIHEKEQSSSKKHKSKS